MTTTMTTIIASVRVEARRLTRSGLFLGLLTVFAFFGLSGPGLALHMPQILGAAAGTEQLTIAAATATAQDGLMLFNQSAMQLGLIFAVAVAITALGWDARAGSSVFYRTRVRILSTLTLPRLLVDWAAVIVAYTVGLALAAAMTALFIGRIDSGMTMSLWGSSVVYLVMAMSVGHLIMTAARRTAAAIAAATALMLILPALGQIDALSAWAPTSLLAGDRVGAMPYAAAALVTIACLAIADSIVARQTLRRDG